MTRTLQHCPAGHQEELPYRGPVSAWCDQCRDKVQFEPVPVIPERIVPMPPQRITRTAKPANFRVMRMPYKD